jgi:hypothetical protein
MLDKKSISPTPDSFTDWMLVVDPIPGVKTATPDIIEFDDKELELNAEILADLLFENIGGQELLTIARYDTVNGQDVSYQPIKNLKTLQQEYNPSNIVRIQQTSDRVFANFPIKLTDKIPNVANGPDGKNIYIDNQGNLTIEFINLLADEQVEIQIAIGGTIYEAGI